MSKKGSVESPKRRRDEGRLKGWEEKHNENHQSQWVGKINRFSDQQIFNKMLGFFLNNCQTFLIHTFLVADKRLYKRLCPSVRRLVGRSVREHESKSGENMHFRPAHPSATGIGRVSGLVFLAIFTCFRTGICGNVKWNRVMGTEAT